MHVDHKMKFSLWVQKLKNHTVYYINTCIGCHQVRQKSITYLSSVAASIYLPLGENFTKDTGGLSSSEKEKIYNNQCSIQKCSQWGHAGYKIVQDRKEIQMY